MEVNNENQQSTFRMALNSIGRMIMMYLAINFLISMFNPSKNSNDVPVRSFVNVYRNDALIDAYFYLNENERVNDYSNFIWMIPQLKYADWYGGPNGDGSYQFSHKFTPSAKSLNNGSIHLISIIVASGNSPNPGEPSFDAATTVRHVEPLTKYQKISFKKSKNLITGQKSANYDDNKTYEITSHYHPNMTVNLFCDDRAWPSMDVPGMMNHLMDFFPEKHVYRPKLYFNTYWNLNSEYQPINDTTRVLDLNLVYSPISLMKMQFYLGVGRKNPVMEYLQGADDQDQDQDTMKIMLLETNPYLLAVTVIISIVHSVFDFLAFKNDIQFWKNRESTVGLSVRTMFFNILQSLIVLLYVFDNNTNFMIRVSLIVSLGIDLWKVPKACNVQRRWLNFYGLWVPIVTFSNKADYEESNTKEYDQLAYKYLSWALFPLLGGYAVYSLLYLEHAGWYSWILSMLYGFLLTFGFIMMTPQLFINYKLKSVAHLPWRMLTYKAMNTFIDDLFAFVIKTPTLYRIGCFRDDIIFFIYLYQRYIYPTDKKRVNEFGTDGMTTVDKSD